MESSKLTWLALLLAAAALAVSLWPSGDKKKDSRASSTANTAHPTTSAPVQTSRPASGASEPSMVEKGYRFSELYFAGRDGNWKYAELQAGKLNLMVQIMAQRNPKRAEFAAEFLEEDMPRLFDAIESQDGRAFDRALQELLDACNTCHRSDNADYIHVVVPEQRVAPVRNP